MTKIVTAFMCPPIPTRQFDWLAMYDDDDGDSPRKGWGATKKEAVADLLNNYEEVIDDRFFRKLTDDEAKEFRKWARDNFKPGDPIEAVWHPVVREECKEIEAGR